MHGINALLEMAASDPGFAQELVHDRETAIATRGVRLTPTELAILRSVDSAALAGMIQNVRGGERYTVDPTTMRITGISPDRPAPRPERSFGIQPDGP